MQINYDDVESEVDDIMSLINEDIKDKTTKTKLNKKVSSTQDHLRNKIIQ